MSNDWNLKDLLSNFSQVVAALPKSDFAYESEYTPHIDIWGSGDKEVVIDDLKVLDKRDGPFSIEGEMVVLYIKDQGMEINQVIDGDPFSGKRVHLVYCKSLEDMERRGRFERYHASRKPGKTYAVAGIDPYSNREIEGEAELAICKNCLRHLNYDNYSSLSTNDQRNSAVINFDYDRYFSIYSSMFPKKPRALESDPIGYSSDWKEISRTVRTERRFTCEECGFSPGPSNSSLLQVHHINSVKTDNRRENLQVLCVDCHKSKPGHGRMWIDPKTLRKLRSLKADWRATLDVQSQQEIWKEFIDPALRSCAERVLSRLRLPEMPEIAYEVEDNSVVVFQADVAFPRNRVGIVLELDENEEKIAHKLGWRLLSHNSAMVF